MFHLYFSNQVEFDLRSINPQLLLFHNLRNKIFSWLIMRLTRGGEGKGFPTRFSKLSKSILIFWKNVLIAVIYGLNFSFIVQFLRVLGKKTEVFPCGIFLICVVDKCFLKDPNSRKLPCPKEFLVMHLFILFISTSYWFEKYKWNINCYCAIEKRVDS